MQLAKKKIPVETIIIAAQGHILERREGAVRDDRGAAVR
jgi:hypothetical protein